MVICVHNWEFAEDGLVTSSRTLCKTSDIFTTRRRQQPIGFEDEADLLGFNDFIACDRKIPGDAELVMPCCDAQRVVGLEVEGPCLMRIHAETPGVPAQTGVRHSVERRGLATRRIKESRRKSVGLVKQKACAALEPKIATSE